VLAKVPKNKNVFSLDLNTDNESLPMTDAGSEFQADGAAHRKERFAKPVRANGSMSSGVADERRNASTRWRSVVVIKPLHAGEAYATF